MMEVIERVSFEDAEKRYGLSRAGLKLRLKALREALGVEPEREGTRAYLSGELLQEMDGLHEFKQSGGTEKAYLARRQAEQGEGSTRLVVQKGSAEAPLVAKSRAGDGHGLAKVSEETAAVVSLVAQAVAEQFAARAQLDNPLSGLEALERAAEKGWILSTTQVAQLLRVGPGAIRGVRSKDGQTRFERHGFVFERAGNVGSQSGWRVLRPAAPASP